MHLYRPWERMLERLGRTCGTRGQVQLAYMHDGALLVEGVDPPDRTIEEQDAGPAAVLVMADGCGP